MINGSCLCGQVTFTASATTSNMTHCHCSICRKTHGSLFATYLEATELKFTGDKQFIQFYNSSRGFTRAFCKACGSVLPENTKDGACFIPAGTLDDDPGIRPHSHIFTESKSDYYNIHDELPQLTHYGDGDTSRVINTQMPESTADRVRGGCQCGDVVFEFTGNPAFVMNCHCSRCRKVKGAAHATNAFVANGQFNWIQGQSKLVNYDLPEAERFGHCFCGRCGSSMPRHSAANDMYNVPVGSLDSSPGTDVKGHIFVGSKAPWFDISDSLPQWDDMPG